MVQGGQVTSGSPVALRGRLNHASGCCHIITGRPRPGKQQVHVRLQQTQVTTGKLNGHIVCHSGETRLPAGGEVEEELPRELICWETGPGWLSC